MKIDPKLTYDVKFARAVTYGRHTYRPLNVIQMSGRVLAAIVTSEGEGCLDHANAR